MTAPRRALIVIDVQQEYFEGVLKIQYPPRDESLANIVRTIEAAVAQDVPVAIVQHRSKDSELLCELLQECTAMEVFEVNDKEDARPGCVYIAPPDYHMLVDDGFFSLSTEAPVRFSQ